MIPSVRALPLFAMLLLVGLAAAAPAWADEKLKDIACRSVHWGYETPPALAFYNEVTIDRSAPGTYFCVCGFNKGYYGLQELTDGEKVLIFSVWDNASTDKPDDVPIDARVKLKYAEESARVGRFGNEGTGAQAFRDFAWQIGQTYRFLVTAKAGTNHASPDNPTEFTAWYFSPETKDWQKFVTCIGQAGGRSLTGGYSFVEDFRRNGESAKQTRTARFGHGWVLTEDKPTWRPIVSARFTADANPVTNFNGAIRGPWFFLSTGGQVRNDDLPLRTRIELPKPTDAVPPDDVRRLVKKFVSEN